MSGDNTVWLKVFCSVLFFSLGTGSGVCAEAEYALCHVVIWHRRLNRTLARSASGSAVVSRRRPPADETENKSNKRLSPISSTVLAGRECSAFCVERSDDQNELLFFFVATARTKPWSTLIHIEHSVATTRQKSLPRLRMHMEVTYIHKTLEAHTSIHTKKQLQGIEDIWSRLKKK